MTPGIDRRRFLGLLGAIGVAGCSGQPPGTPGGLPTRDRTATSRTTADPPTRRDTESAVTTTTGRSTGEGAWPQFQHDGRNTGHSTEVAGPKRDVEARWRFDTGDHLVRSSPVVQDGTVYLGSGTDVYAVDLATGEERWRFEVDAEVIASPTAVDDAIYAVSRAGTAYRLDAVDGTEHWSYRSGARQQPHRPASPAVGNGRVVFGSSDGLHAVATDTGRHAWSALTTDETGMHGAVESTPAVLDGVLYVGHASGMYALSVPDGETVWRTPLEAQGVASSPAVAGDHVFVGARDGNVYLFDRRTGRRLRRFENEFDPDLHAEVSDEITTSPVVADGVVYAGSEDFHAYAWDVESGERLWRHEVGGRCYTSPAVVDGIVHVGGVGGILWGLDAATGDVRWSYRASAQLVDSSPAVVEGVVVIGDGAGVLHAVTGESEG